MSNKHRRKRAEMILAVHYPHDVDAMLAFADEEVAKERARYVNCPVYPPNEEGKTSCIVRWMIETPCGWIGSWDKRALDNVIIINDQIDEDVNK